MSVAEMCNLSWVVPDDAIEIQKYFNKAMTAAQDPDADCLSRRATSAFYSLTAGGASLINAAVGYPLQTIGHLATNLSNRDYSKAISDLFTDLLGIAKSLLLLIAAVFNAIVGFFCPDVHNNMYKEELVAARSTEVAIDLSDELAKKDREIAKLKEENRGLMSTLDLGAEAYQLVGTDQASLETLREENMRLKEQIKEILGDSSAYILDMSAELRENMAATATDPTGKRDRKAK